MSARWHPSVAQPAANTAHGGTDPACHVGRAFISPRLTELMQRTHTDAMAAGERRGYTAGVRAGRIAGFAWGLVAGTLLVAGALKFGMNL